MKPRYGAGPHSGVAISSTHEYLPRLSRVPVAHPQYTMALVKLCIDVPPDLAQGIGELLIELGAGAVEEQRAERGARLVVYGENEGELAALGKRARAGFEELGLEARDVNIDWRIEVDPHSDWDTAWTKYLVQQPLTPSWVIQPAWDQTPAPPRAGRIFIQPTLAFGDGGHVTTRMAARAVERFCVEQPGANVLDIGTGTGVLAMVAALSGAGKVVGTDIDPVALAAAVENAKLNGLEDRVLFLDACATPPFAFDLVVANLEPRVLLSIANDIAARARESRELVLTGFVAQQAAEVEEGFVGLGFGEMTRIECDGWCLLAFGQR